MRIFEETSLLRTGRRRTNGRSTSRRRLFTRKDGYHEFQLAMLKHMDDPEANPEFDPDWYTD